MTLASRIAALGLAAVLLVYLGMRYGGTAFAFGVALACLGGAAYGERDSGAPDERGERDREP